MKTIIQTIGPLYGDDANGTVFGQPNGSVYTPPNNELVIFQNQLAAYPYVFNGSDYVQPGNSNKVAGPALIFKVVGQVPWVICTELSTDSAFTNIVSTFTSTAPGTTGVFGLGRFGDTGDYTIVNGTTYYARVRLLTYAGHNQMAVSDTYILEGLV